MLTSSIEEPVRESFAAYVAHELRTPLATQRALLELALSDEKTDAVAWREIGEDVLGACRQQERLLEACLTLARGRAAVQRVELVDLAAITADVLRAHDFGELERVVVLEQAWTGGDPDLIERLVSNVVSNAVRHNVPGGQIEARTCSTSGRAVLSVANTGPLIQPIELDVLFEPFHRLDRRSDGLGIGLAIVRAIANAHGADVTAYARPGGGLEIDIAFPTLA